MAKARTAAGPEAGGSGVRTQQVTAFLTFKERGEEAVKLYVSLFSNSRILSIARWEGDQPVARGALMHAAFELDGQRFMAMDAGPHFSFSEGFSLFVNCETQEEIDRLWEKLSEGGEKQMCGWLKDRYGVSWQIIPSIMGELMTDTNAERSKRVMEAMLKMDKLEIAGLQRAYQG